MPTDLVYLGSRKGIGKKSNKPYWVLVGYWFDKDKVVHAQEFFVTQEIFDAVAGVKSLAMIKVLLAFYDNSNHIVQIL